MIDIVSGLRRIAEEGYRFAGDAADEIERLRAKIEQMEKQVPICRAEDLRHAEILLPSLGLMPEDKLYALPGAQPAPSEQDASVRKAWARFSHELHRGPDAPYPGMSDAFEQHFSQSFTDREWRAEAATWAAAWKAAKRHCGQIAPSVPDRWKLVPIEPTLNMLTAATLSSHAINAHRAEYCYRAMLAAAPEFKL